MLRKLFLSLAFIGLLLLAPSGGALAGVSQPEGVQVPIIMYHSLAGMGRSSTSISGEAFEADLRYLRAQGYQAVTITALAAFVHQGEPLPERPVVLTFDDGYYNNYSVGLSLAEQYGMPIAVSVIGKDTEIWSENLAIDEQHGHVTWEQIREMAESGFVEILNHTWDLHKHEGGRSGAAIRPGEDLEHYRTVLEADVGRLQESLAERSGVRPFGFVYPFGKVCPEGDEILAEMGFLATLSCYDGVNTLTVGDPACLFSLRRFERGPERSLQMILESLVLE